jgi:prevent-host-death family protein
VKSVTIADLKNNLSRYLREVRQGESMTVLSRDVPVARLVPIEAGSRPLVTRPPNPEAPKLQDVPLPPPLSAGIDIVELLLAERGER